MNCIICGSNNTEVIFSVKSQPLARYGFVNDFENVKNTKLYDIEIIQCGCCKIQYNSQFKYKEIDYSDAKRLEAKVFSSGCKKFMDDSALKLKSTVSLDGKTVLEIGCGDGYFLSQFLKTSRCIGFEPSPEGEEAKKRGLEVRDHYFDPRQSYDLTPSLIIMRQVLEHLSDPLIYLKGFSKCLSGEGGYLYIEVPNSNITKDQNRFYDYYYEHHLYFTTSGLSNILELSGFRVIYCEEKYNSEVLVALAKPINNEGLKSGLNQKIKKLARYVTNQTDTGKSVVGWGASGNGSTILNICNIGCEKIKFVIDSDDRKHNLFIPGTGQKIISAEYLENNPPDIVMVFSQFHKNEIKESAHKIYGDKTLVVSIEEILNEDN